MQCPYCKETIQDGVIKCMHCQSNLSAVTPNNGVVSGSQLAVDDYIAFVGKNAQKCVTHFNRFNVMGVENFKPAWLWPAFIFGPFWMFYRKLYLWGLLALFLGIIPYVNFIAWIAWGLTGYYLYFKHATKRSLN